MYRSRFIIMALAIVVASPANAVVLVNRDDVPRKVYVCGDGCDVVKQVGKFIDIAPKEIKPDICNSNCFFVITTGEYVTMSAIMVELKAGRTFSGQDVVTITNGKIEKKL